MKRVLSEFVLVSYFLGKVYELQCEGESFTRDITISGRRVAAPSLPPLPCSVGSTSDNGGAFLHRCHKRARLGSLGMGRRAFPLRGGAWNQ